jgi:hypothetical protein
MRSRELVLEQRRDQRAASLDGTLIPAGEKLVRRLQAACKIAMASHDFRDEIQQCVTELVPLFSDLMAHLKWYADACRVSGVDTKTLEYRLRLDTLSNRALRLAQDLETTKEEIALKALEIGLDEIDSDPEILESDR